jgi:hypothetical protein
VVITDVKDLRNMHSCEVIHVSSFLKTVVGVQTVLRFGLSNLRGCNVSITDEMDFQLYV